MLCAGEAPLAERIVGKRLDRLRTLADLCQPLVVPELLNGAEQGRVALSAGGLRRGRPERGVRAGLSITLTVPAASAAAAAAGVPVCVSTAGLAVTRGDAPQP